MKVCNSVMELPAVDNVVVAIYDKVAANFAAPQVQPNIASAIRWFKYVIEKSDMVKNDLALFALGSYLPTVGLSAVLEKAELICEGAPVSDKEMSDEQEE